MEELLGQTDLKFDRILFASSSGGTHAGLAVGARVAGYPGEVLGISIDEELGSLQEMVAEIATGTSRLAEQPHNWVSEEIHASADYLGAGYGIMGTPEREAIDLFARLEGILLDPVYTGRAAAGMIDMVRSRIIGADETILFWHTGGTPALWAYADQLA
jgi:1-aminocyclopropane-1-carboxylate deaminase/D-cysteine desulfhydrase-like pyridoxal-dependent ACC family enzyme